MATRRYEPQASFARSKGAKPKQSAFWLNPDVYFGSRDGLQSEASSDSFLDNANEPRNVLLAGHVGAKGFPDPHYINEADIREAVVNGHLPDASEDDLKHDLQALDHIHRESIDEVIQYYLKDGRRAPDTKQKPKAPLWSAAQPPRRTRVIPANSDSLDSASVFLPTPVKALPPRQKREHAPENSSCPCCAEVNAENSRRRRDVTLPRRDHLHIDFPTPAPSSLPSLRPATPPVDKDRLLEEIFHREPLSAIIRKEPEPSTPARRAPNDLYLVYDDNDAYLNYARPLDQVVPVENIQAEERRRLMEVNLMHSDSRFRDSMVRLSRQIRGIEEPEAPEQLPVRFPTARLEPPPLVRTPQPLLTPRRAAAATQRSVKFSEDSPIKFLYTPLTSPEDSVRRY